MRLATVEVVGLLRQDASPGQAGQAPPADPGPRIITCELEPVRAYSVIRRRRPEDALRGSGGVGD